VIVLVRGAKKAAARLDAQIRVGGDAGASEVIVLRGYGPLASAEACAGMTIPMLLPDAPVVVWWPGQAPPVPAEDPVGRLANRRITDAAVEKNPVRALEQRAASYSAGDTDLAWTRLTLWRALLASALDQPPYDEITSAVVDGEPDSPSTDLLAGWLRSRLTVPVKRTKVGAVGGMHSVRLNRASGPIEADPAGRQGRHPHPARPAATPGHPGPAAGARLPRRGAAPPRHGRDVRAGAARAARHHPRTRAGRSPPMSTSQVVVHATPELVAATAAARLMVRLVDIQSTPPRRLGGPHRRPHRDRGARAATPVAGQ